MSSILWKELPSSDDTLFLSSSSSSKICDEFVSIDDTLSFLVIFFILFSSLNVISIALSFDIYSFEEISEDRDFEMVGFPTLFSRFLRLIVDLKTKINETHKQIQQNKHVPAPIIK